MRVLAELEIPLVLKCLFIEGNNDRNNEAIDLTGIDWVELAERQHEAMLEDIEWALGD